MPINKSSGTITADEIRDEFGPTGTVSFADYRVSETHGSLTNMPLDKLAGANQDKNIPSSGVLSFSDFYNSRVNVVVKVSQDDVTATDVYDNNNSSKVKVVGGLRSRPSKSQTGGRRVYINVNTELESPANHEDHKKRCTLRTGEWVTGQFNNNVGTGTSLSVDIGSSGKIYGAGGRGGNGGNHRGQNGNDGSSALGIEFGASNNKVFINNAGYLQAGYGGGGGGGGGYDDPNKESHDYENAGAGGGGGAGKIHGEGGGGAEAGSGHQGRDGSEGDAEDGGDGGGASGYPGTSEKGGGNEGSGGAGGEGGGVGSPATNGGNASGNSRRNSEGGTAGESGWAILNENASNCIIVTGSGTVADNKIQHNTNPED